MRSWLDVLHHWSQLSKFHYFSIKSCVSWGADTASVDLIYMTPGPGSDDDPVGISIGECGNEPNFRYNNLEYFQDDYGNTRVPKDEVVSEMVDNFGNISIESNNYYYKPWKMHLYGFNVGEDFNKMIPFAFEKFYEHFGHKEGVIKFDWNAYKNGEE